MDVPQATAEEVAMSATVLVDPELAIDLEDYIERAGDSITDDMIAEYNERQAMRTEAHSNRRSRRAQRQASLELNQPDFETK